jgi:RNA-directed DNA polymerase
LYPHVEPSKKTLQNIKDRVTNLTKRERTIMPFEWIVKEVKANVRGWTGYFHTAIAAGYWLRSNAMWNTG